MGSLSAASGTGLSLFEMSAEKQKPSDSKGPEPKRGAAAAVKPKGSAPAPAPTPVPPLFRRVDWFTFTISSIVIFIGYWLTLSPNLTLEDSGELATGSFYAGVPHPP